MPPIQLDTPSGPARAHLHRAEPAKGLLALGHGAGGGVEAPDLIAARDAALGAGYTVALVELDEQRGAPTPDEALRIIANVVTREFRPEPEANIAIGKRVRVVFQDIGEDWALPQVSLTDEPPVGRVWRFPG